MSDNDRSIPVETEVRVWPGTREGRERPAITLTECGRWLGGQETYRIQYLDTGGFDYIAAIHIERCDQHDVVSLPLDAATLAEVDERNRVAREVEANIRTDESSDQEEAGR